MVGSGSSGVEASSSTAGVFSTTDIFTSSRAHLLCDQKRKLTWFR
jgi:hypothetical protein